MVLPATPILFQYPPFLLPRKLTKDCCGFLGVSYFQISLLQDNAALF